MMSDEAPRSQVDAAVQEIMLVFQQRPNSPDPSGSMYSRERRVVREVVEGLANPSQKDAVLLIDSQGKMAGDWIDEKLRDPEFQAEYERERRKLCEEEITRLQAALRKAEDFISSEGYQPCDIPACNCGQWHGGNAAARLREIYEALGGCNGTLPVPEIERLQAALRNAEAALRDLAAFDLSTTFDAKGSYSGRKSDELRTIRSKNREAIDAALQAERGEDG